VLNFANQLALGSTSGGRAAETSDRLKTLREETARNISKIGEEMEDAKANLAEKIKSIEKKN